MMRQQGPGKLYSSSCKVFDSKSHCLQLRHFVPPNKPVSNNSLTALIPTAIRTGRKFKKKTQTSQLILIRFFKVLSFPFVIQSVYGVLPYFTSVSHHAFPVASLINRQHVMIPRCSNMADPKRPIKLHWKQNNIHAVKILLKSGMSEYSQTCYKILIDIQIAFKHQVLWNVHIVYYIRTLCHGVDMTFCPVIWSKMK